MFDDWYWCDSCMWEDERDYLVDDELVDYEEYVRCFLPDDLIATAGWDEWEEALDAVRNNLAHELTLLMEEEERWGGATHSNDRSRLRARNFRR